MITESETADGIREDRRPGSSARLARSAKEEFELFYYANFRSVYAATYAFAGSQERASEATQEAFARAWARWRRLRRYGWSVGWVATTAINVSRRQHRKARKERSLTTVRPDQSQPAPSALRVDVVRALAELPPRQRQSVVLHYIADCPVAVVADLMGLAEGTVKAHLAAARGSLRTNLYDYAGDPAGKGDSG